jgi:hypothetical protein
MKKNAAAVALGRKGGLATKKKGRKYFQELQRKSVAVRMARHHEV